jgi:hypothetical protein
MTVSIERRPAGGCFNPATNLAADFLQMRPAMLRRKTLG